MKYIMYFFYAKKDSLVMYFFDAKKNPWYGKSIQWKIVFSLFGISFELNDMYVSWVIQSLLIQLLQILAQCPNGYWYKSLDH